MSSAASSSSSNDIRFPFSSYLVICSSDNLSTEKNLVVSYLPSSKKSSSILPGMGSSYGPFLLIGLAIYTVFVFLGILFSPSDSNGVSGLGVLITR